MTYVDTAMVGHLGEKATASVSTTTSIIWLISSLPYAFSVGLMAMVSRSYGAQKTDNLNKLAALSVKATLIFGTLITFLSVGLAPFIPGWMNAAAEIQHDAAVYFAIISIPSLFKVASVFFGTCLQAVKDTKTPMIINLSSNVLNVFLNALFIYGLSMGVKGAAIASGISFGAGGIVMTIVFFRRKEFGNIKTGLKQKNDICLIKEVSAIAIPALLTSLVSCTSHVVFTAMVSGMGTTIFAAHSIAIGAEELFYLPGYGLRTATSTLVGIAIGENKPDKLKTVKHQSIFITITMMIFTGILLFIFSTPLMKLFTSSCEVAKLGAQMLKIVAFSEPFFGLTIVWEGICYGLGKAKRIFIIESFSMWGIRILSTYIVINILNLGLKEVWYCMILDNIFKALMLTLINLISVPEKNLRSGFFS
ncbi:MAG: MATE family efflux transporter [Lachnospiraceae bacterium]|nr:MATE family efflux transporter [Lachnospiraceae bacterium]